MSEEDEKRAKRNQAAMNGIPWPTRATLSYLADIHNRVKMGAIEIETQWPGLTVTLNSLRSTGHLSVEQHKELTAQANGISHLLLQLLRGLQNTAAETLAAYGIEQQPGDEEEGWPVQTILEKKDDEELPPM